MKPTDRSFLEEADEEEEDEREVLTLGSMMEGMVYWRAIIDGMAVEFLRMERDGEAVVTVGAKLG